jgi:hypothetical protein
MKRFILVLAVAALMAVMLTVMVAPAFAKPPQGGTHFGGGGGGAGGDGGVARHNPHKTCGIDSDGDGIVDVPC